MNYVKNEKDLSYVVDLEKLEFLDCYLFLTSFPMNQIKTASGEAFDMSTAAVARLEYNPVKSAWIWYSYVISENQLECFLNKVFWFQMTDKYEYRIPPIPSVLYQFYKKYR